VLSATLLASYDCGPPQLQIAYFYTYNAGKIGGVLKGYRTGKKNFTSSLEIFSLNELIYYPSRSNLHLVSFIDMLNFYAQLRKHENTFYLGCYIAELIDKIMPFHYTHKGIFLLIILFMINWRHL